MCRWPSLNGLSRRGSGRVADAASAASLLCTQGTRTTVYKRCTHEIFAAFGECARWDGLVERVTRFADDERHVVEEVRATP